MYKCIRGGAVLMLALSGVVFPGRVWAWGEEGHRIVARIAEAHLSGKARDGIRDLIGNASISDFRIALWADEIKRSAFYKRRYPNNQMWHYIDLDVTTSPGALDLDQACRNGDCVLTKLPHFIDVLRDAKAHAEDRQQALRFVVHLVGDAHQPLHCAERNKDRGGNLVRVKLPFDEGGHAPVTNLHSVWDTDLVREAMGGLSWSDFADRLDAQISREQRKAWANGDLKTWVLDANKLARDKAYADVPLNGAQAVPVPLTQEYLNANAEVVREQLQRAGVRLAKILNDAFE